MLETSSKHAPDIIIISPDMTNQQSMLQACREFARTMNQILSVDTHEEQAPESKPVSEILKKYMKRKPDPYAVIPQLTPVQKAELEAEESRRADKKGDAYTATRNRERKLRKRGFLP